ncbi:MAG TPA: HesA/MoeB/ThiF family protein [Spirochaetia bacterium]|nr:HesA/MoeB/ThiF family protein [Spirochaetia bacterium]
MPENDHLTEKQYRRYQRNILLPAVGTAGQEKLCRAGVLLVGAGGLGSPAAYYLAAAGVGRIGLIDGDTVSLSNLQRQILHSTPDLGRLKVLSAGEKLTALNPDLKLEVYPRLFDDDIAGAILEGYDFIVDCTDNFQARYTINKACVKLNKPFVYGGVLAWAGQAFTILPGKGPCFSCLFPEAPRPGAPTTADVGVLGAVPGVIGAIQAAEAVRFILGVGELLVGRILTYDCLSARFHEVLVERNMECPECKQLWEISSS